MCNSVTLSIMEKTKLFDFFYILEKSIKMNSIATAGFPVIFKLKNKSKFLISQTEIQFHSHVT